MKIKDLPNLEIVSEFFIKARKNRDFWKDATTYDGKESWNYWDSRANSIVYTFEIITNDPPEEIERVLLGK